MNYPVLRFTDQGDAVKYLQNLLNKSGNYNLTEDGIFGQQTYNAVKDYQGSRNLPVDGCVCDKTWAALLQETGQVPAVTQAQNNNNQIAMAGFGTGISWKTFGIIAALGIGLWIIGYKIKSDLD